MENLSRLVRKGSRQNKATAAGFLSQMSQMRRFVNFFHKSYKNVKILGHRQGKSCPPKNLPRKIAIIDQIIADNSFAYDILSFFGIVVNFIVAQLFYLYNCAIKMEGKSQKYSNVLK